MPAQLEKTFANDETWKKVAHYVDEGLREYGYYNYEILLRPATKSEQAEITDQVGIPEFVHCELDEIECSAVFVFGINPTTGHSGLDYQNPAEFARINIVDTLDEYLQGDLDDEGPGRSFKVIDGGKNG